MRRSIVASALACVVQLLAGPVRAAPGEVVMEIEDEPAEPTPSPTPSPTPAPTPAPATTPGAGRQPIAVPDAVPGPEGPVSTPVVTPTSTPVVTPTSTPVSTSVVTSTEPARVETPVDELALLRARVDALEAEHKQREGRPRARLGSLLRGNPPPRADVAPTQIGFGPGAGIDQWGVRISGYVQTQYQWSQLSEDQLQQGGAPLNQNRFMIRRGRVRVSGDWRFVAFDLELDGSTTRGPFVGVRQANVSVLWRNPDARLPPYLMVTAGLTESPFGHELRLGQRDMIFMERSAGSLAFFPGPVDVGVRVRGGISAFRYDLAVMNGTPLDDRAGARAGFDPTSAPDYMGRLGFEARPKKAAISGGVSFLYGTGFHAGQDAGKSHVEWSDFNENGALDSGELVAVPGRAATPSLNFKRWAVNADFQLAFRSKAGWSQLLFEATMASNLDRDFLVADPVVAGADLRELHGYAAYLQELYRWAIVGARYDFYDPNSDLLDQRRGAFVPAIAAIHTVSPVVGAVLPGGVVRGFRGRLMFQYDAVHDALGRDARGVPANLRNDQFIVRLQGEF